MVQINFLPHENQGYVTSAAANTAILKRLAEIDKTLLEHASALRTGWKKLQPLLQPPPEPPKRRIGFNRDKEA
jgi:hypothetical protein